MNKILNFGILGPGIISHRFVNGFQYTTGGNLFGVASRDIEKAKEYAKQYNIPNVYTSYQEMIDDPKIDVIYIATPPFLHYEQVLLCLNGGKHVICEKPFVATRKQVQELFRVAREKNVFLMEAMKAVFLPATKEVKKWILENKIGQIKYIQASYCYDGKFPETHWVYQKDLMGGGMFDVGVYPVAYINELMNSEIVERNRISIINKYESDDFTEIVVRYSNGVVASLQGAITLQMDNKAVIYGTKGKIIVEHFWKANKAILVVYDSGIEEFEVNQPSEFTYQIQEVIDCIHQGKIQSDIMGEKASLQVLEVIGDLE